MAGIPQGMLGRGDLTGIILGGEVPDPRVKAGGPTMTVLLVTRDELEVAFHFGAPRVANLLGYRGKFFPYPPWVDRRRTSLCSPAGLKSSPVAQIHTLLYISPEPLNAEEIAETLNVARSNVSTSLRELQGWRIVKLVHVLGDKTDHFESMKDVWKMFRIVLDERKRRA